MYKHVYSPSQFSAHVPVDYFLYSHAHTYTVECHGWANTAIEWTYSMVILTYMYFTWSLISTTTAMYTAQGISCAHCVYLYLVHMQLQWNLPNRPSEIWTTSVKWTARKAPFDFCMHIFNLWETDNCNLSVADNEHSARPRMIVAVQRRL